ncbi:MAG: hypothetical protein M1831_005794 [Alyxoria varia]|nr:MAG: hypothetical protein M1831_005794 [Alyxoria varia]
MSTTEASTAPAAEPNVAQHNGYVDASSTFKDAQTGESSKVEDPTNTTTSTTSDAVGAPAEEKVSKDESKVTATPVTSGTLGYKAPGLVNQLRFKKHYFWLGGKPVPTSDLSQYLRGEKPEVCHPTAAWSSQTGKGLLYFSKGEDSKNTPIGVVKLADATDVTKEGVDEFSFRVGKQKHTFQAKNQDERNGWVVAFEQELNAAKDVKDTVTGSEGYQDNLKDLDKPTGNTTTSSSGPSGLAAKTKRSVSRGTRKDKEHKEDKDTKEAELPKAAAVTEPTDSQPRKSISSDEDKKKNKTNKSRSVSRNNKRTSIFGMFGKKDEGEKQEKEAEKDEKQAEKEEKKEEKKAEKQEKKEEKQEEKEEKAAEKEEQKAEKEAEKDAKKEEKTAEEKSDDKNAELAAAGVAGTAADGATVPSASEEKKIEKSEEVAKDDKTTGSAKGTTDRSKSTKRRSIFGGFFEKAKPSTSEKKEGETTEIKDSGDVAPQIDTAVPETNTTTEESKPADIFKDEPVEAPSAIDKENTAPTESPSEKKESAISPSAGTPASEKRRSNFFNLGSKKEKKPAEPSENTGDATTSESPKSKNKFGEMIFRRPSKAVKSATGSDKKDEKKNSAAPTTVPEDTEGSADKSAATNGETIWVPTNDTVTADAAEGKTGDRKGDASIGDVVPEAVTVTDNKEGGSSSGAAPVSTAA